MKLYEPIQFSLGSHSISGEACALLLGFGTWNLLHLTLIMAGRRTAGWLGLTFAGSSAVHSNQLHYKQARRQAWNADQQVKSLFPTPPALGSFSRVKCEPVTSGNRFKLGGKLIPKALAIDSERTYPLGEPPNLAELVKPIYANAHLQQGLRHTLDPQIHATFFDALTLYFNEENVIGGRPPQPLGRTAPRHPQIRWGPARLCR